MRKGKFVQHIHYVFHCIMFYNLLHISILCVQYWPLPSCPKGRRSCVGQSLIWLKNFSLGLRFGVGVSSWGPHTASTSTRIRSTSTSSTRTGWPGSSSSRWPASPHHPASSTPEILKSFIKLYKVILLDPNRTRISVNEIGRQLYNFQVSSNNYILPTSYLPSEDLQLFSEHCVHHWFLFLWLHAWKLISADISVFLISQGSLVYWSALELYGNVFSVNEKVPVKNSSFAAFGHFLAKYQYEACKGNIIRLELSISLWKRLLQIRLSSCNFQACWLLGPDKVFELVRCEVW